MSLTSSVPPDTDLTRAWAAGYGAIRHTRLTQQRVAAMASARASS